MVIAMAAKIKEKPVFLPNTKKAIELYDWVDARFREIDFTELSKEDGLKEIELHDVVEQNVGLQFGLETADRNNPITCYKQVRPGGREPSAGERDVSFVRRMVRDYEEFINS